MSSDGIPQSDQLEGAPHPRETSKLFGHSAAEAEFLTAHKSGRLHHAWMITGPRGVGKATLAWRMARYLMNDTGDAGPSMFGDDAPADLNMSPDHPVFKRVAALSEPGIALCRRSWDEKTKRLRTVLNVDEVRKLKGFFSLSASDGGWRVAIIDAADEMNTAAANALLKLLEEPPARCLILLVCHRPDRLLPTIRSRCRTLRLSALTSGDLAQALENAGFLDEQDAMLAMLAGGSVGEAVRLMSGGGVSIYRDILYLLSGAPGMDRGRMLALGDKSIGRAAEPTYDLILRLTSLALGRLAFAGASGDQSRLGDVERALCDTHCTTTQAAQLWAGCLQEIETKTAHARLVNLDPGQVILDMFLSIEKTAAANLSRG